MLLDAPKFAADRMLLRLARWLRLLGADTITDADCSGAALLKRARDGGRIFLTRDKRLRTASDTLFIESNAFREQLRQVLEAHPFDTRAHAFSRCSECNEPLIVVSREAVARRVPMFVYASHESFAECPRCGRIYWQATHPARALAELQRLGF